MKKIIIAFLEIIYVASIIAWIILGCVFQVATSRAGIAVLEVIGIVGFGAWILQNYCEWRWEM